LDAVLLGLLAGALFGALSVAVRFGLGRGADPGLGAAVITSTAFVVAALAAAPSLGDGLPLGDLWPFALVGLLVPGLSQVLFVLAVRHAGASRSAILIGTAPLLSVALALVLLDEPLQPVLLLGTALVVAGGAVLAGERERPAAFRALGLVLALTCAGLFALRDNAVRYVARDVDPDVLQATAASLLAAAAAATLGYALRRRTGSSRTELRTAVTFVPAGVVLALAYAALVGGFARGRVALVAPLNATQSLWAVVFASLLYARSEVIGRRTVLAGVLVVAGGALIGAFR
jgi:drug/metabolite transporter (DMT)-like permease